MTESPYCGAVNRRLVGLCLSGGGIRSATFALGLLQTLAECGVLSRLDYLSTVSGGGYIGGWLEAWIQRANIRVVERNIQARGNPLAEQNRPIRFLREYSQYLAPRSGFMTADLWTMVAIFARNLILNQSIILLILGAMLTVPLLLIGPIAFARTDKTFAMACLYLGAVAILWASWNIREACVSRGTYARWNQADVLTGIMGPTLISSTLFVIGFWGMEFQGGWQPALVRDFYAFAAVMIYVGFAIAHFGPGWSQRYGQPKRSKVEQFLRVLRDCFLLLLTAGFGTLFCAIPKMFLDQWHINSFEGDWRVLAFGPALMLLAFALTDIFYIGLFGRILLDGRREWWARLGAWLALASAAWMILAILSIWGPNWLYSLDTRVKLTAAGLWAGISAAGTRIANGEATGDANDGKQNRVRDLVTTIAPYVFIAGLLCFMALGVQYLCVYADEAWPHDIALPSRLWQAASTVIALVGLVILSFEPQQRLFAGVRAVIGFAVLAVAFVPWVVPAARFSWSIVHPRHPFRHVFTHYWATMNFHAGVPILVFALLATAGILLSMRVNVNEFSMHYFYRNRLVRAYLGASRERKVRRPNPFSGFDERDDVSLCLLRTRSGYYGPFPLVNAAVNVTRGDDLATQERQAESFTFTPLRCGFDFFRPHLNPASAAAAQYGYQTTDWPGFGRFRGIRLGTVMAISGAAVNPNMGYHSKPAVAFLLSLFNVRLGWWLRNPSNPHRSEVAWPRFGLLFLLRVLAGYTNVRSRYINLSDGGHFENMGLYELVRRRCLYIILSDAEQDEDYSFAGLGAAIRKCRTDFGVTIDLDPRQLRPVEGTSKVHCAIGTVTYPESNATGYIVYIKASLTGDEPADILEYQRRFKSFPHQSTTDQFFTESQFESYRCLGQHAARIVFAGAQPVPSGNGWQDIWFKQLYRLWI